VLASTASLEFPPFAEMAGMTHIVRFDEKCNRLTLELFWDGHGSVARFPCLKFKKREKKKRFLRIHLQLKDIFFQSKF